VGVVNKVSSDHIGLLVHGIFNASIPADQIRDSEFSFNSQSKTWMRIDAFGNAMGESVAPGSILKFSVSG
jgi:hypothetical protein